MTIVERRDATQATLERFTARPFSWHGRSTCVHMVRHHLRAMGHRPPPVPDLRSPLSAAKALKARGWADLSAMMDAILPQIAPAEVIVGDVVELPGEGGGLGALCIAVGNGRVMGYTEEAEGFAVMQPASILRAWRA